MNFVPLDLYKQYRLRKRAVHENWVPPNSFSYNSIWRNTKEFFIFYFIFLHSLKKIKLSTSHSFSIAYFSISVFLKTPPVHTGRPFFAWEGGLVPGGVRQAQALGRPAAAPRTLGVPEYQQQILQVHEAEEELRAVSLPPGQMECPRGPQFVHCHSRAWKGETCKRNGAKDRPGGAISSLHDCRHHGPGFELCSSVFGSFLPPFIPALKGCVVLGFNFLFSKEGWASSSLVQDREPLPRHVLLKKSLTLDTLCHTLGATCSPHIRLSACRWEIPLATS